MTATSSVTAVPDAPIGTALAGTTARVLDSQLVPCPDNEVGEIYLAGPTLARGYLGRPDLTAERFVADPHGAPGSRMYRTGDLGKWVNGALHYCGRVDNQVKIRGFRVEPGETAAHIERLAGVKEAHVLVSGPANNPFLVAAVATQDADVDIAAMHEELAARLPEYLRPSRIVRYDTLPRTSVGKLDLRALKADLADDCTAPTTDDSSHDDADLGPTAVRVKALMSDTLDQPVGGDSDFFALGGHSLSALRLIGDIEREFGATVSLRSLFDAPTPRALAREIAASEPIETRSPEPEHNETSQPGPAQERMLLLQELVGGPTYTIALHWRLDGEVDTATLARAWRLLIDRHTTLRTCYPRSSGETACQLLPSSEVPIRTVDIPAEDGPARDSAFGDIVSAAADEVFDVAREAPLRLVLAPGSGTTDIGVLVHHVATDEHGLELLQQEFVTVLDALDRGEEPQLPPLPLTSGQFAAAQRARERGRGDRELAQWRDVLDGNQGSGELPADLHGTESGCGTVHVPVPGVSATDITRAAQRLRLTPFMLFHGAVAVALQRAGAGDDLVLASPVAGRAVDGAEGIVDCATNTVPIRHTRIGDGDVGQLVARTRDSVLDSLDRTTVSYDAVQRELGGGALSDVLVSVYQTSRADVGAGRFRCASRPMEATRAKASLAPTLVIDDDGASVIVEHDNASFSPQRTRGIAGAIANLVSQLSTCDTETPVGTLSLVTTQERARLLGDWGGEAHDLPQQTFAEHFLRAAEEYADQAAVTADGTTLTYAQLLKRAQRCAARIQNRGVGSEDVVAVSTDRGIDMVVSHVAVLISGATFLAIDPSTPAERVATLTRLLPPKLFITSGCELPIPESLNADVIRLDGDDDDDPAAAYREPAGWTDALAYVIFTSGTTGEPKPVGLSHQGVSKLIATQRRRLQPARGCRVLSFATPTFDASFWQLCGTLCDGGELVVMPDECRLPGPAFVDFIVNENIDVVSVPPSVLGALPADAELPAHVQLIIGAERLSDALVQRWGDKHQLFNAYGPSEATVNTTLHHCRVDESGGVPIGKVDPGMRGYVLDTAFTLCPIGFPGELVIGGEGVARGYLGDPVKTANSFVADPFAAGQRCYRSGDRVVWRDDGALEFLGRIDDQIKLRGFRIEPGEIVAALEELPAVRQAAVIVRKAKSGQRQLVGYVVTDDEDFVEDAARAQMRDLLPSYLVPDRVCRIPMIPRLPSGKIDRRALPEPPARRPRPTDQSTPSSPQVERVCRAFARALDVDEVLPDDDFFALGGSSLTAASLLRTLGAELGKDLTFGDVLSSPTPAALADAKPQQDPLGIRLELRPGPAQGALPEVWFLPPLAGMSWCYAGLRKWIDPRRRLAALQFPNLTDSSRTPTDFTQLVTLWADEIERFRSTPGEPVHLVGWSFGGAAALGVASELQRRGHRTGIVAMLDTYVRAEWGEKAPTRAESMQSMLQMLGVRLELGEAERLDPHKAAELMAAANPVLAGLDSFDAQCINDNIQAGPILERTTRFDGYCGDLLVFSAERTASAMSTDWRAWRDHVDGSVDRVPVDTTHQDMVGDEALAVVGPELDRALHRHEARA